MGLRRTGLDSQPYQLFTRKFNGEQKKIDTEKEKEEKRKKKGKNKEWKIKKGIQNSIVQ